MGGEGKGWRATREGRAQWTASEIRKCRDPRPWIGDGWRTLPQLDRRTMHPGRRMLTLAITRFSAGIDGFSGLLSASEPPIVAAELPFIKSSFCWEVCNKKYIYFINNKQLLHANQIKYIRCIKEIIDIFSNTYLTIIIIWRKLWTLLIYALIQKLTIRS